MDVYIYIYSFTFLWLFELEHTEIQFGWYHVGFGPKGLHISQFAPRMKLKRIIYAGTSNMTMRNYFDFLRKLEISLIAKKYCFFRNNCRHVTRDILQELHCDQENGEQKLLG